MPGSPITRTRTLSTPSCILGFTGNALVKSYVFDATTLTADANGYFSVPIGTLVTISPSSPTMIKAYQALGTNQNAVQTLTITGTPTGGTFTLTFNGATTTAIAYNASAATVQAALQALSSIGTSNVTCSGGALPGSAVVITFADLLGNSAQPLITVNYAGLTGGSSPAATVVTTTPGTQAEKIIGVYDGPQEDFFGNVAAADEAVAIYSSWTSFDTTLIQNWLEYGDAAIAALPFSEFVTP